MSKKEIHIGSLIKIVLALFIDAESGRIQRTGIPVMSNCRAGLIKNG